MYEKVEHLLAQKTQRRNNLHLPLRNFFVQILFNKKFSFQIFKRNIMHKINRYF